MVRTYLGYGYTNNEGVATLDYDSDGNELPKKSYACHSSRTSVVAEASIDNVVTASNSIRFCEGYVPPSDSLSLVCDKQILSYVDNDSATLTATFESADSVSGKSVVFKVGDTVLDTIQTDSEGVAEYTYNSQGVGDVTITAECMNLQETYELQDIYFARMTEYSATKNDGYVVQKFIDDSTSLALPSNFEMEFKYKTTGGSSSAEMRLFIMPRSLYVSGSQPSYGWFIGDTGCSSWEFGCRRSGSSSSVHKNGLTCNEWHTVKFTRSSDDNRVYCYVDGDFFDYYTLTNISNYSDYCFCFHNWANGTMSIKDITIKEL